MASQDVSDLVDELVGLAGDEPTPSKHERPRDLIVALWDFDRECCKRVIRESMQYWEQMPFIADEIRAAARVLNDGEYLALLKECAQAASVPEQVRIEIWSLAAEFENARIVSKLEATFRAVTKKVLAGKLTADKVDFASRIREICRLQLRQLTPELQSLVELYESRRMYLFHVSTKAYFDAALKWFNEGVSSIREIASDQQAPHDLRVACVFCLGCVGDASLFYDIAEIYRESDAYWMFDLRLAAVEAIVYCASIDDVEGFLDQSLKRVTTRNAMTSRSYDADVGLLLTAVYNIPILSDALRNRVAIWCEATNKDLAAMASVGLEKHGIDVAAFKKSLGRHYINELEFRRNLPSPLMLMPFRPKH